MSKQTTTTIDALQNKANAGDAQAQFDIALCYINGTDIETNKELALDWNTKAAENGHVDAQFALGLYYFIGVNDSQTRKIKYKWVQQFITDKTKDPVLDLAFKLSKGAEGESFTKANASLAFVWFKKATAQNHAEAGYWLGQCYQNGWGTEKNDVLAFECFKQSVELGYADAYYDLALCYRDAIGIAQDYQQAFYWITKATEEKDVNPETYLFLGDLYANGYGVQKNDGLAFKWYEKAATKNVAEAEYRLACYYEFGKGVKKSIKLASEWYAKAYEQGISDADSQYRIAECFLQGNDIDQSYKLAFNCYEKAAKQDHSSAKNWLKEQSDIYADIPLSDEIFHNNEELYIVWVTKAAEQGKADAQYRLACCYLKRKSLRFLESRAIVGLYEKAAKQGHYEAKKWMIGYYIHKAKELLSITIDEEKNEALALDCFKKALDCFKKAAEFGCAEAQFILATSYRNGIGTNQDNEYAFEWFKKAAEQGFADAEYQLACCYQSGEGITQSDKLAFKWFASSAAQGYTNSYSRLGFLYDEGKGCEKNDQLSFKYFKMAAELDKTGMDNISVSRCYKYGLGVKQNEEIADQYLLRVSEENKLKEVLFAPPSSPEAKAYLALRTDLYIQAGRTDLAKEYYEEYKKHFDVEKNENHFHLEYIKKSKALIEKNQQLEAKNQELNNIIAMFAHNFLGTLQCIRSNAEHQNNPSIHLKTVKMMGGTLTAFSILSADDEKLIEQLEQDKTGDVSLMRSLANNLALAVSQLLSKTNKDKIINLYLKHLRQNKQIERNTNSEELRANQVLRKKWQKLQHQWEDEFNALFSESVDLSVLQTWIADNLFPIQITGFDEHNIRFKEYGITDSIFLVVFMEIFVNALKYMDVTHDKPLEISLSEQEQCYILSCENPSLQETGKGTHKGTDFLKTIAKKINGDFNIELIGNSFKASFSIPTELLK